MVEVFRLVLKSWDRSLWVSLPQGSANLFSVLYFGIGSILVAWLITVPLERRQARKDGRAVKSFRESFKSWPPYAGAVLSPILLWIVLTIWNMPGTIREAYAGHIRTIQTQSGDISYLKTQLEVKPQTVTQQVALPTDPSLMKPGQAFSLVAEIRHYLETVAGPVNFVVTSPELNRAVREDIEAVLAETCRADVQVLLRFPVCVTDVNYQGSHPIPNTAIDSTVLVSVSEPIDRDGISDRLVKSLSRWFNVKRRSDLSEITAIGADQTSDTKVWIQIGPGNVWRRDAKSVLAIDGIPPAQLDSLSGWDKPPKAVLTSLISELEKSYRGVIEAGKASTVKAFAGPIVHMPSNYAQNYMRQVVTVIRRLKNSGVDVMDAELIAKGPKDFMDVDALISRLKQIQMRTPDK
jgi:hypothetical protein